MVKFAESSFSDIFPSASSYICQCLGFHSALVKYYDMGKGYDEPVYQQAKCYGLVYECKDFNSPSEYIETSN